MTYLVIFFIITKKKVLKTYSTYAWRECRDLSENSPSWTVVSVANAEIYDRSNRCYGWKGMHRHYHLIYCRYFVIEFGLILTVRINRVLFVVIDLDSSLFNGKCRPISSHRNAKMHGYYVILFYQTPVSFLSHSYG